MGQSSSNYQATHGVPNEANLTDAGDRTKGENVLFNFCGQTLAHFHDITFGVVLVALGKKDYGVWVLE